MVLKHGRRGGKGSSWQEPTRAMVPAAEKSLRPLDKKS
jgi:hypothetical protein